MKAGDIINGGEVFAGIQGMVAIMV